MKNQESAYKMQENLAEFSEALMPLVTMLTDFANDILPQFTDFVANNKDGILGALGIGIGVSGVVKTVSAINTVKTAITDFKAYLPISRGASKHTIRAYQKAVETFLDFVKNRKSRT